MGLKLLHEYKMVAINDERLKELAIKLHEINALKFGDFEMKIGLRSPVYFDLRIIISHPNVMVSSQIAVDESYD